MLFFHPSISPRNAELFYFHRKHLLQSHLPSLFTKWQDDDAIKGATMHLFIKIGLTRSGLSRMLTCEMQSGTICQ